MANMGRRSLDKKAVRASGALATDYKLMGRKKKRAVKRIRGKGLRRRAQDDIAEQG
jgi:hypothetical protein